MKLGSAKLTDLKLQIKDVLIKNCLKNEVRILAVSKKQSNAKIMTLHDQGNKNKATDFLGKITLTNF